MAYPKLAPEPILIERAPAALRRWRSARRRAGETVGLVPTMGALHEGHLALVAALMRQADRVVVSIFVNPTQFAPGEDFARYPRRQAEDLAKLAAAGADVAYMPSPEAMYPDGFVTDVTVGGPLTERLEAAVRPGHFTGVATVVAKLFQQIKPNIAAFGEKDYQQLQVVRRLTRDLDLPVEILAVPTVRDHEGLALSSRNAYLSADELQVARQLNKILAATADRLRADAGLGNAQGICVLAERELLAAGFTAVDYVALADPEELTPMAALDRPGRLLAAACIGGTRLIDNIPVVPLAGEAK